MTARADASEVVQRVGRRIAGARVEKRLTQADVAKVAGTSAAQVSLVENAKHENSPRLDLVIRIANAVGLKVTLEPAA